MQATPLWQTDITMTTENSNETAKKTCPINDILENLRAQLHAENQLPAKIRPAVARVARLVTEVTLGRGNITGACHHDRRLAEKQPHGMGKPHRQQHLLCGYLLPAAVGALSGRLPRTHRHPQHDGACRSR